jgi:hypothetical protein
MALTFPDAPALNELYPVNPGLPGISQYRWDGGKWVAVTSMVSLGTANQGAYNTYQWPSADGIAGNQLTTDGSGNLTWDVAAAPSIQVLQILPAELPFDGVQKNFTLVDSATLTPFTPVPSDNIVVFLGGVPQQPNAAYSVTPGTPNIAFTEAPLAGTLFYAISNVLA